MSLIAKILVTALLVLGVGGGLAVAQASQGRDDPPGELRGPCDEAEHANDPRCVRGNAEQARGDRAERNDDGDRQRRKRQRGSKPGRSGSSQRSGSNSGHG